MITATALELKAKIENHWNFTPINLKCNGGFGYGPGTINFKPDGDKGSWLFTNAITGFEPSDEFLLKTIAGNYQVIKEYFSRDTLSQAASAMGKLGGSSKSTVKSTASRENGKLGGRPKKA